MRLVPATGASSPPNGAKGRLEIFHDGQWGTVGGYWNYYFSSEEVDVVCRQMGYKRGQVGWRVGVCGCGRRPGPSVLCCAGWLVLLPQAGHMFTLALHLSLTAAMHAA